MSDILRPGVEEISPKLVAQYFAALEAFIPEHQKLIVVSIDYKYSAWDLPRSISSGKIISIACTIPLR
jgi:hypothetical protein